MLLQSKTYNNLKSVRIRVYRHMFISNLLEISIKRKTTVHIFQRIRYFQVEVILPEIEEVVVVEVRLARRKVS